MNSNVKQCLWRFVPVVAVLLMPLEARGQSPTKNILTDCIILCLSGLGVYQFCAPEPTATPPPIVSPPPAPPPVPPPPAQPPYTYFPLICAGCPLPPIVIRWPFDERNPPARRLSPSKASHTIIWSHGLRDEDANDGSVYYLLVEADLGFQENGQWVGLVSSTNSASGPWGACTMLAWVSQAGAKFEVCGPSGARWVHYEPKVNGQIGSEHRPIPFGFGVVATNAATFFAVGKRP